MCAQMIAMDLPHIKYMLDFIDLILKSFNFRLVSNTLHYINLFSQNSVIFSSIKMAECFC